MYSIEEADDEVGKDDDTNEDQGSIGSAMESEVDSLIKKTKQAADDESVGKALELSMSEDDEDADLNTVDDDFLQGYLHLPRKRNHIVLDKPWVFEDQKNVKIYKMVQQAFYEKPINTVALVVYSICLNMIDLSLLLRYLIY